MAGRIGFPPKAFLYYGLTGFVIEAIEKTRYFPIMIGLCRIESDGPGRTRPHLFSLQNEKRPSAMKTIKSKIADKCELLHRKNLDTIVSRESFSCGYSRFLIQFRAAVRELHIAATIFAYSTAQFAYCDGSTVTNAHSRTIEDSRSLAITVALTAVLFDHKIGNRTIGVDFGFV